MNWINKTKLTIRKDKSLFSNIDKLNTRITNLPRVLCVLRMCTGCKHTYCVLRLCMDIVINEYVIWLFRSASDRGALWSGVRVSPIEEPTVRSLYDTRRQDERRAFCWDRAPPISNIISGAPSWICTILLLYVNL